LGPKISDALALIGERQMANEKGANVLLRTSLLDWACSMDLPVCTSYAQDLLDEWNGEPAVNP